MSKYKATPVQHHYDFDVVIVGSGPGGYEAAIRSSQLGLKTCLVEKEAALGGVCLNWGCIPTKSLLKNAEIIHTINDAATYGISLSNVKIDLTKIIDRSRSVASVMAKGVEFLMKKNSVTVKKGFAKLTRTPNTLQIEQDGKIETITALNIVLATGTKAKEIPNIKIDRERIITSYEALLLKDKPETIAIIGAGAIGVEFSYFYNALGSKVVLIEFMKHILPNEDEDISLALEKSFKGRGIDILTGTKVETVTRNKNKVDLNLTLPDGKPNKIQADYVLVAVGLIGNIAGIGLEDAGVKSEKGFIVTNGFGETNVKGICAIGDVAGGALLAHKASSEGIRCIEHIAGLNVTPIEDTEIPACTYCQPSVAHVGLTEKKAKEKGFDIKSESSPLKLQAKLMQQGILKNTTHVIGIVQPTEDATLDKARKGYIDALADNGFSEKNGSIKFIYRNAQNDIPTLNQIIDFFIAERVTAIAANATLSMLTAASKTTDIPIFVMTAPAPALINLVREKDGQPYIQSNLSGVYDTLTYIDKNLRNVRNVFPAAVRMGTVFNTSEPNSQNAIARLRNLCQSENFTLFERAVTNSNEIQQAVESLLSQGIEIFFALPDNTVFSTFENIVKLTYLKKVPIVTSEIGLVKRGATIASGPDIYLWGYEAGEMTAEYLKNGLTTLPHIRAVSDKNRKKAYNPTLSHALNVAIPPDYEEIESEIKIDHLQ
ncbi:hypothetical protein CHS0354_024071 [Potamilus streckersoni]|uniref:Dihydrolipoyl dehydrogenase n=1 Tax=Potamilus streckersoni TaxID=2493646 RepID=A0AAE0RZK8_9BIVA|nr:hypothetical protein CHS0354_024071 [Potamilus streckersoni]